MDMILVASDALLYREQRMRRMTVDFGLAIQRNFDAGPVDDAYRSVHDRWKESQNELVAGLANIADILKSIREAFEEADRMLSSTLAAGPTTPSPDG
ncbi:MAG: hypothetical protein ACSLFI_04975 [Solirubrobacterales bacterium]